MVIFVFLGVYNLANEQKGWFFERKGEGRQEKRDWGRAEQW
jgi:hypothetical protein